MSVDFLFFLPIIRVILLAWRSVGSLHPPPSIYLIKRRPYCVCQWLALLEILSIILWVIYSCLKQIYSVIKVKEKGTLTYYHEISPILHANCLCTVFHFYYPESSKNSPVYFLVTETFYFKPGCRLTCPLLDNTVPIGYHLGGNAWLYEICFWLVFVLPLFNFVS